MHTTTTPFKVRGAAAIIVALALIGLIAFAGLALDLGRIFIHKTELQNIADACALAASRELNVPLTTLAVLTRAENAGITVGRRNLMNFQGEAADLLADRDVKFSSTLDGFYAIKSAATSDSRYARCSAQLTGILPWFMQVTGVGANTVTASAVATMQPGSSACALPMGMCLPPAATPCAVPGATPDANGLCKGQWYSGRFDSGGGATGSFNWINLPGTGNGASVMTGLIEGPGLCNLKLGDTVEAKTGMNESVATAWNSRFGLYKNGGGNPSAGDSPPDYSGYAYTSVNWPSGRDAYADFAAKQSSYQSYGPPADTTSSGNLLTGLGISNSYQTSTSGSSGTHATRGADRRVVLLPTIDCAGWASGHTTTTKGWACTLMLTPIDGPTSNISIEYLGIPGLTGVPCGTYGQAGGPSATGPRVPTMVQ